MILAAPAHVSVVSLGSDGGSGLPVSHHSAGESGLLHMLLGLQDPQCGSAFQAIILSCLLLFHWSKPSHRAESGDSVGRALPKSRDPRTGAMTEVQPIL